MKDEVSENKISTGEILNLLYNHHEQNNQFVCADEVGDLPAFANRRLDFVACDCWQSSGFRISAFEIKISKSDLRHDLEDPSKHNVFFDFIDTFTIIAPDYVLDAEYKAMIPPKWGIVAISKVTNKEGQQELKWRNVRKPLALCDDQDSKRTFNRAFAASILRRCQNHLSGIRNNEIQKAYHNGYEEGRNTVGGLNWQRLYEEQQAKFGWMRDIIRQLGITRDDPEKAKEIIKQVKAAHDLFESKNSLEWNVKYLRETLTDLCSAYSTLKECLKVEGDSDNKEEGK